MEAKEEYLEDEGDLLQRYCSYLERGKSHKQAAAYLRLNRDSSEQAAAISLPELLSMASEQGTGVSLSEASGILQHCGLPEQAQYASAEGQRFLEACELFKQQGKTYAEVAAHFGVEVPPAKGADSTAFDDPIDY